MSRRSHHRSHVASPMPLPVEAGARLRAQLDEIARNLWWSWNPMAIRTLRDLDPLKFRLSNHNAVAMVATLDDESWRHLGRDAALRARVDRLHREFHDYLARDDAWADVHAASLHVRPVAYFSAEFGLHESLPIYSGGLGVLAGDHLKSASDLGVPLVGVGLFYKESYFRQRLDRAGAQHAEYVRTSPDLIAVEPALAADGGPLNVAVELGNERLHARVWRVRVGRNLLFLLDTDVAENSDENRQLAARLYFGDARVRIRQELLLGVGGIRALHAAGIAFGVLHLNEGHSAFAPLEWARLRMEDSGAAFETVAREVAQATVFTTHTPVDAGHDRFSPDLVERHLEPLRASLRLTREAFLGLGRVNPADADEMLCMTVLAFKMSRYANAVSSLHGRVTRRSWQVLWPHHREDEVPVGHVTNGVHVGTWLAPAMHELYARHIGADWQAHLTDPRMWARIATVPDSELWQTHRALKADLVDFVRRRVADQRAADGYPDDLVQAARDALDPEALTIGFARRFATYKRASLILTDRARLERLLGDAARPVQFVFAGKAHPADRPGQDVLRAVHQATLDPALRARILFIEDYDINVGRHLVQGVDVWLNNPRRPHEASGTSGQKVLLNGGLNLSVLDGWWAEAWDGDNGFAVGDPVTPAQVEDHDRRDAEALYATLEREVVPLFFTRDEHGVPTRWVAFMKRAIRTLGWRFNTDRMVMDYVRECYLPAAGCETCRMPK